jgi:hypothetical protein
MIANNSYNIVNKLICWKNSFEIIKSIDTEKTNNKKISTDIHLAFIFLVNDHNTMPKKIKIMFITNKMIAGGVKIVPLTMGVITNNITVIIEIAAKEGRSLIPSITRSNFVFLLESLNV